MSNLNICKEQLVFYNTKVEKYKVVENLTNQIIMDYLNNIIEKLVEMKEEEYKQSIQKREQKELDDIISVYYHK